jgi:TRAP-type C4-dicarboxylate transport system permease small subunit
VRVTLLIEHLSPRTRVVFEAVALAVAAVFTGYLAWWAVRYVYESWKFKEISTGVISVPIWIPQLSFSIGATLLFVAVVEQFWEVVHGRKPLYQLAVEERHARGDFSEDY